MVTGGGGNSNSSSSNNNNNRGTGKTPGGTRKRKQAAVESDASATTGSATVPAISGSSSTAAKALSKREILQRGRAEARAHYEALQAGRKNAAGTTTTAAAAMATSTTKKTVTGPTTASATQARTPRRTTGGRSSQAGRMDVDEEGPEEEPQATRPLNEPQEDSPSPTTRSAKRRRTTNADAAASMNKVATTTATVDAANITAKETMPAPLTPLRSYATSSQATTPRRTTTATGRSTTGNNRRATRGAVRVSGSQASKGTAPSSSSTAQRRPSGPFNSPVPVPTPAITTSRTTRPSDPFADQAFLSQHHLYPQQAQQQQQQRYDSHNPQGPYLPMVPTASGYSMYFPTTAIGSTGTATTHSIPTPQTTAPEISPTVRPGLNSSLQGAHASWWTVGMNNHSLRQGVTTTPVASTPAAVATTTVQGMVKVPATTTDSPAVTTPTTTITTDSVKPSYEQPIAQQQVSDEANKEYLVMDHGKTTANNYATPQTSKRIKLYGAVFLTVMVLVWLTGVFRAQSPTIPLYPLLPSGGTPTTSTTTNNNGSVRCYRDSPIPTVNDCTRSSGIGSSGDSGTIDRAGDTCSSAMTSTISKTTTTAAVPVQECQGIPNQSWVDCPVMAICTGGVMLGCQPHFDRVGSTTKTPKHKDDAASGAPNHEACILSSVAQEYVTRFIRRLEQITIQEKCHGSTSRTIQKGLQHGSSPIVGYTSDPHHRPFVSLPLLLLLENQGNNKESDQEGEDFATMNLMSWLPVMEYLGHIFEWDFTANEELPPRIALRGTYPIVLPPTCQAKRALATVVQVSFDLVFWLLQSIWMIVLVIGSVYWSVLREMPFRAVIVMVVVPLAGAGVVFTYRRRRWQEQIREQLEFDRVQIRERVYELLQATPQRYHAIILVRDGILFDPKLPYHTTLESRDRVLHQIWPCVVQDLARDNRVSKARMTVDGTPRECWRWRDNCPDQ